MFNLKFLLGVSLTAGLVACGGTPDDVALVESSGVQASPLAEATNLENVVPDSASGTLATPEPSPEAAPHGAEDSIVPFGCEFSSTYNRWMNAQDAYLGHGTGTSGSYGSWYASRSVHSAGHLTYGPYDIDMGAGTYVAEFNLSIDDNFGFDTVATIDVVGNFGGRVYATANLIRSDFFPKQRTFKLYFKNPCHDNIEARVYFHNRATIQHYWTRLAFSSFDT